jgi:pimeloyl-ACP methyl ester carboxylesterase
MIVLGLAACALGLGYESLNAARDARKYPPRGAMIDVGGYRLHLLCTGTARPSTPTVVLDTMAGGSLVNWAWIQPALEKTVRVCSYDRAGDGWSERGPGDFDLHRASSDLYALLSRASETGPFVLVGHSLGGLIVRRYAADHPADVAGVVLVDASHSHQFIRHPEYLDEARDMSRLVRIAPLLARFGLMRLYVRSGGITFDGLPPQARDELLAAWSAPKHWRAEAASLASLEVIFRQAQDLDGLGSLPLAVVTAGRNDLNGWTSLQSDLAALSTESVHVVIDDATHASLAFDPAHAARVAAVILEVASRASRGDVGGG